MSDPVCKACGCPITTSDVNTDGLCGIGEYWADGCTRRCEVWYEQNSKKEEKLDLDFLAFHSAGWQVVVDKWLEAGCPGMVQKGVKQ